MDFSGFPYDSHTLEIPVTAYGLSGNALVLSSRNPALSAYSQNVEWILHEDDVSCETTYATYYIAGEQVPVLTYLTQLDKYFSSIFAILFFLSIGHVCIGNLIKSDEDSNDDDFETKSRKLILGYIIDVIMRIVTPFLAMFFFIYYALEHWTPATIMVTVFSCVLAVMLMISGVYNGKLHYDAYIQTQKDRSLVFILRLKFYSIYLSLLSLY
mmetsp:Transcript_668/g.851  ORF Transcript_668/g.851 Transcript_668/m.851 type:complete len:212 (+) Transcript_668:193-828(+)